MDEGKLNLSNWADVSGPQNAGDVTVVMHSFRITTDEQETLLSVSQFADEARITPQAVRKMIAEDRLHAQRVGEQHVISRAELNRYLAER